MGVDCGVRLENIYGGVTLAGGCDGRNFYTRGELAIDSLSYKDRQFTRIMGPLWIDDQQVLLGSGRTSGSAKLAAGRPAAATPAAADRHALRRHRLRRRLGAAGRAAPLRRARHPGRRPTWPLAPGSTWPAGRISSGRSMATVELQRRRPHPQHPAPAAATSNSATPTSTSCRVMVAMLKMLSIRAPDPNAFSKSDIDFHIQGEHVYFDSIDFTGDAISLLGKGEMNMQSEIHLAFTAIVGRGDVPVPLVRDLSPAPASSSW